MSVTSPPSRATPPPPRPPRATPSPIHYTRDWTGVMEFFSSSVRPLVTLLATLLLIVTTLAQIPVPDWVQRICELIIGFYFISRAEQSGRTPVGKS